MATKKKENLEINVSKKDTAAQMGRNGCAYVKKNFDWDIIVDKYKEFFENMDN